MKRRMQSPDGTPAKRMRRTESAVVELQRIWRERWSLVALVRAFRAVCPSARNLSTMVRSDAIYDALARDEVLHAMSALLKRIITLCNTLHGPPPRRMAVDTHVCLMAYIFGLNPFYAVDMVGPMEVDVMEASWAFLHHFEEIVEAVCAGKPFASIPSASTASFVGCVRQLHRAYHAWHSNEVHVQVRHQRKRLIMLRSKRGEVMLLRQMEALSAPSTVDASADPVLRRDLCLHHIDTRIREVEAQYADLASPADMSAFRAHLTAWEAIAPSFIAGDEPHARNYGLPEAPNVPTDDMIRHQLNLDRAFVLNPKSMSWVAPPAVLAEHERRVEIMLDRAGGGVRCANFIQWLHALSMVQRQVQQCEQIEPVEPAQPIVRALGLEGFAVYLAKIETNRLPFEWNVFRRILCGALRSMDVLTKESEHTHAMRGERKEVLKAAKDPSPQAVPIAVRRCLAFLLRYTEAVRADCVNRYLRRHSAVLVERGPTYERVRFAMRLASGIVNLDTVRIFIRGSVDFVVQQAPGLRAALRWADGDAVRIITAAMVFFKVTDEDPITRDHMPHTLLLDVARLQVLQIRLESIAQGAAYVSVVHGLVDHLPVAETVRAEMLIAILERPVFSFAFVSQTINRIFRGHGLGDIYLPAAVNFAAVARNRRDPCHARFIAEVQTIVRRVLIEGASLRNDLHLSEGLRPFIPRLASILESLERIALVNAQIHGETYTRIIRDVSTGGGDV